MSVDDSINNFSIVKKMKVLYDNYEADSKVDEISSDEEHIEENEFISALLETSIMKYTFVINISDGYFSNIFPYFL